MVDIRLLYEKRVYIDYALKLVDIELSTEYITWEKTYHDSLQVDFKILKDLNASEVCEGYDAWAQSKYIIASYNNIKLLEEIELLTKSATFTGR